MGSIQSSTVKRAQHGEGRRCASRDKISIVIPTIEEAGQLAQTMQPIQRANNVETIVVDASSVQETRRVAETLGCRVLSTAPGRAAQMNAGAAVATGPILLFLHADTQLPGGFEKLVRKTLQSEEIIAGAFRLRLDAKGWAMRLIEWAANLRSRSFGVPYGDQAIFMRACDFKNANGFTEMPIMEDFELMHRMRKLGRLAMVPADVVTSARRWQRLGPWRTTLINQAIILGYRLGVSPDRLAQWYAARKLAAGS